MAEAEAAGVAEAVKAAVEAVVPQLALAAAAVDLVAEAAVEWEGAEVETVAAAALEQVRVMQA